MFSISIDQVKQTFSKVNYNNLFEFNKFIPPEDPHGIWRHKDGLIYRKSKPGTDQIGDIRVTYECLSGFASKPP